MIRTRIKTRSQTKCKFVINKKTNTMQVSQDFNEDLDMGREGLKNIHTLIFKNCCSIMDPCAMFNKKIFLTPLIKILIFGDKFNQPFVLTRKIIILKLGDAFNQPIILTKHIRTLKFGNDFNQPIVSTKYIINLTFGIWFNQPLVLTQRVMVLTFNFCFNQPIILTQKIKYLIFGGKFNQPIAFTPNLTHLALYCYNHHIIDNLSNDVKELILDGIMPMNNIPNNIGKIIYNTERDAVIPKFRYGI